MTRHPTTGPANPYARSFVGFWGMASLLLVDFRADNPTYRNQIDSSHRASQVGDLCHISAEAVSERPVGALGW